MEGCQGEEEAGTPPRLLAAVVEEGTVEEERRLQEEDGEGMAARPEARCTTAVCWVATVNPSGEKVVPLLTAIALREEEEEEEEE